MSTKLLCVHLGNVYQVSIVYQIFIGGTAVGHLYRGDRKKYMVQKVLLLA